ncbi:hypothetical protein F1559_000968 [Cyanidiococcus yangmingshanensis]|uniref:FAD:protein FMN transferase n=1 Tax=Cyanidiococcus yangmingshanensis TaxID=2690220 RepID=A0A7J7INN5_9RHOD|nr:hypothetical protein F1559_000968 [Cyanidiococcus yangmingshanensis]
MGCLFSVPDDGYFHDDEQKVGAHYDSLSTASGIDDTGAADAENECTSQESSLLVPADDLGVSAVEEYFVHDDQWCRSGDGGASASRYSIESVEKRPLVMTLDDVKQTIYGARVLVTFAGSAFGIPLVLHTHWQHMPSPAEVAASVDGIRTISVPESILSAVLERVRAHMEMCHRVANRWNSNSELSSFCRQACSQEALPVTPQLFVLLQEADRLHRATGGRYDPTCGALWRLFRDKLSAGEIQNPLDERQVSWENVGWSDLIHLDGSGEDHLSTAQLSRCGAVLDLDGLLKGWIVDQIDQCLRESFGKRDTESQLQNPACGVHTIPTTTELRACWLQTATEEHDHREAIDREYALVGAFVDWGSEIRAWGEHPSGRKWRTLVIRPPALERLFAGWRQRASSWHPRPQEAAYLLAFERAETALGLATSGDYFQMERFGFYHILSPLDKCIRRATKDSIASVTVLACNATTADAFATAAMTFQSAH